MTIFGTSANTLKMIFELMYNKEKLMASSVHEPCHRELPPAALSTTQRCICWVVNVSVDVQVGDLMVPLIMQ